MEHRHCDLRLAASDAASYAGGSAVEPAARQERGDVGVQVALMECHVCKNCVIGQERAGTTAFAAPIPELRAACRSLHFSNTQFVMISSSGAKGARLEAVAPPGNTQLAVLLREE